MGLFALGWHVARREQRSLALTGQKLPFMTWEVALSILLFAAVAGARYHTGYDHAMYLHQYVSYEKYGFFTRDFEPLFMWVTQLMASAHIHYFFYFALWAAIEIAVLYYALNDYKQLIPWVALFLVLGPVFIHLMNTMRQGVAECAVPLVITQVLDKKYVKAMAIIALLTMVHYASFLLLLLLMIPSSEIRTTNLAANRTILLSLLMVSIILGIYPVWFEWLVNVMRNEFTISLGQYDQVFASRYEQHVLTIGPMRLLMIASQMLVIGFYAQLKKQSGTSGFLRMVAICSMIYLIATNLLTATTNYFQRPFELFIVCYVVLVAAITVYLLQQKKKVWAYVTIGANCVYIFIAVVKAHLYPDAYNLPFLYETFLIP